MEPGTSATIHEIDAADDEGAYDGNLPDFTDEIPLQATATASKPQIRIIPRVGTAGGPPRKKIPPPAPLKKKVVAPPKSSAKASKDKAKADDEQDLLAPGEADAPLPDELLDKVMAQLALEHGPEAVGTMQRLQVANMVSAAGITQRIVTAAELGEAGSQKKDMSQHKFWATQPVPRFETPVEELHEGPLEPNRPVEEIRKEPYELHPDFAWSTMNLADPVELKEVYELLTLNYVEDEDATFRFDYSADFINWALKPPGYVSDWHVGIRVATTKKLVAFISGVPVDLRLRAVTKRCTEINFLCVHKKLRSKRLAPLLIKEVTRRTHLHGVFQAIYTAGVFLPTPISRCRYFHRSLNIKKLVATKFTSIPRDQTMARMLRRYAVPEEPSLPGLREMEKKDLKQVGRLLRAYLARMDMAPLLSNKEVEHALFTGRGKDVDGKRVGQVTWAYVVEDPVTHRITDLFSFYSLPSTAVKEKPLTCVNAAYLFYYATTSCPSCADLGDGSVATPVTIWKEETDEEKTILKGRLITLIGDALVLAKKLEFDVFNALTLQDNTHFLDELKFGKGDGYLHYYLYNYVMKPIDGGIKAESGEMGQGSGVGVVML